MPFPFVGGNTTENNFRPVLEFLLHMAARTNEDVSRVSLLRDVSRVFCEFLEVAVHQILFARAVYPAELFERKR